MMTLLTMMKRKKRRRRRRRTKSLINEKKERSRDFRLTKQIFLCSRSDVSLSFFLSRFASLFHSVCFSSLVLVFSQERRNHRETIADDLNEQNLLLTFTDARNQTKTRKKANGQQRRNNINGISFVQVLLTVDEDR